ncbi:MAG: segregation/condensation protein A [Clostridiales bacterium]|nr:segregation/condensation protein A [Clostridiales bacterium]
MSDNEKGGTTISYKLESFEGPLDLLLHLIEKNKIDIYDIPIAEITRQYLDYVNQMEHEDLDVVSDFLVMAATLLDIKSRMLLPAEPAVEGDEEDPRAELVERLLEYKRCKRMAQELGDLEDQAGGLFLKAPTVPEEVALYEAPVDLDRLLDGLTLARLEKIFGQVMKRQEDKVDPIRSSFGTIKRETVSLEQRVHDVLGYARQHRRFSFRQMLEHRSGRLQVVVTFLAILELMKVGKIRLLEEDSPADDINLETIESDGEDDELELDLAGLVDD